MFIQDSSNSGANVKRLDQESNDQMKEIQKNIAAKKKEVSYANVYGPVIVGHMVILHLNSVSKPVQTQSAVHLAGDGQAVGLCHRSQLQGWCHSHVDENPYLDQTILQYQSQPKVLSLLVTYVYRLPLSDYDHQVVLYCTYLIGTQKRHIAHICEFNCSSSHGYNQLHESYRFSWFCMQIVEA